MTTPKIKQQLKKFATYVREQKLDALLDVEYDLVNELEMPLMAKLSYLDEATIKQMMKGSLTQFLDGLIDGNGYELVQKGLDNWLEGKDLQGLDRMDITLDDILLGHYAQKLSLMSFLPEYAPTTAESMPVLLEMEEYYRNVQDMAVTTLTKIEQDEKRKRLEAEERYTRQLEKTNSELRQYAYLSSHDLKEPLRKVMMFSDMLLERYSDILPAEGRMYLAKMNRSLQHMTRLINDILGYSALDHETRNANDVDLNNTLAEILSDYEPLIKTKRANMKVGVLPVVKGSTVQLKSLLQNLVSNALKYSRNDMVPEVEISATENDTHYRIIVRDNGIGFDMQYSDRIFQIFKRLVTRDKYEGTGIGLAICKKIAENHGGYIMADSRLNEGAIFTVGLPKRV